MKSYEPALLNSLALYTKLTQLFILAIVYKNEQSAVPLSQTSFLWNYLCQILWLLSCIMEIIIEKNSKGDQSQ